MSTREAAAAIIDDGTTHSPLGRDERVNAHSKLCLRCSNGVAQSAAFWTDDANFVGAYGGGWDETARFAQIQREVTDRQRDCRENCGRTPRP